MDSRFRYTGSQKSDLFLERLPTLMWMQYAKNTTPFISDLTFAFAWCKLPFNSTNTRFPFHFHQVWISPNADGHTSTKTSYASKQECIPVGCVPTAAVAATRFLYGGGGRVCLQGQPRGGGSGYPTTPPLVNRLMPLKILPSLMVGKNTRPIYRRYKFRIRLVWTGLYFTLL